jgi:hypothetical protein
MHDDTDRPLTRCPDVLRSLERAILVARRRRQLRLALAITAMAVAAIIAMWVTA